MKGRQAVCSSRGRYDGFKAQVDEEEVSHSIDLSV